MSSAQIADTKPIGVDLEEGKTYFFCTCGRSTKQPFCDGSHKDTDFMPHKFKAQKTGKAFLCMCKNTKNVPFCDGSHKDLMLPQE